MNAAKKEDGMRKIPLQIFVVLLIAMFASLGVMAGEYGGHHGFKAEITGGQAVPPVKTLAKGEAAWGVAITGVAQAIASRTAKADGSLREGRQKISAEA